MTASTSPSAPLRLLAVHAHPDDESSKGAATMAIYAAAGVDVLVATCTDGSRGDIQNPAVEGEPHPKRDMAGARRLEMEHAAKVLGVRQRWLGFVDSGLPEGDPLPPLPAGSFATLPLERAAAPLVRLVRALQAAGHPELRRERRLSAPGPHHGAPRRRRGLRSRRGPGPLPGNRRGLGARASCTTTAPSAPNGSVPCILRWRNRASSRRTPNGSPPGWKPTPKATPRPRRPTRPPPRSNAVISSRHAMTRCGRTAPRWTRRASSSRSRRRCSAACGRGRTTR